MTLSRKLLVNITQSPLSAIIECNTGFSVLCLINQVGLLLGKAKEPESRFLLTLHALSRPINLSKMLHIGHS